MPADEPRLKPSSNAPTPEAAPAAAAPLNGDGNGNGHGEKQAASGLVIGALGIVFGDIGTSPLYTMRETFTHGSGMAPTPEHVLGVLSVLFWAVMLTVTIKYVALIMRADNKGEGGVLALATLAIRGLGSDKRKIRGAVTLLAVIGLALFYGDLSSRRQCR